MIRNAIKSTNLSNLHFFHIASLKAAAKRSDMYEKNEQKIKWNPFFSFTLYTESTNHEMNEMRFANHKSTDIIIIYRANDISCAMNNYDLLSLIDREDIDVIYDDLTSHTRLHPYSYFTNCVYMPLCTYICIYSQRMPMVFDQCSNDGRNLNVLVVDVARRLGHFRSVTSICHRYILAFLWSSMCLCAVCGIRDLYTLIQCTFCEMASNANVEVCSCHFDAYDVWKVANRSKFRIMRIFHLLSSYPMDWLLQGRERALIKQPVGVSRWLAWRLALDQYIGWIWIACEIPLFSCRNH